MARNSTILALRSTRANLNTQAAGSNLKAGEPYLITDENRLAIGLSPTSLQAFHKQNEAISPSQMPALTGDVTSVAGAVATTLATVNSNVGTFGSSTQVAQVTVDGKGRITAASNVTLTFASTNGATFTGKVTTAASATGGAGFNIAPGVAPTTPANGDLWTTTANLLVRINGVTQTVVFSSSLAAVATSGSASDLSTGTLAVARGGTGATATTGSGSNVLATSPSITTPTISSPTITGTVPLTLGMTNASLTGSCYASSFFGQGLTFSNYSGPGALLCYDSGIPAAVLQAFNFSTSSNIAFKLIASSADLSPATVKFSGITTTASGANAFLDSANGNSLLRSTSSLRYKQEVESLDPAFADRVLELRPVWYRSKAAADNPEWSWFGLIAEEVAEVEPRLVHWGYAAEDYDRRYEEPRLKAKAQLRPDAVQYDRLSVLLLSVIQRQEARIVALERQVALLNN